MTVGQLIDDATRSIGDWPVAGVAFRDITPLLGAPDAFAQVVAALREQVEPYAPDAVVGVEARGFLLGAPLALALGVGFVPVRKQGKLPADTHEASYALEYGTATVEIHADALAPGARAVVVDDVLATGGTLNAAVDLVRRCGADPVAAAVMIELAALHGREVLDIDCHALRVY
ncbi:MAG: adenine phosphoribosyltransferase [Aeromicrobium sp.]|uniref:adenine phosphoribosyltransferase n=1 Tax=Aeromicrobium sp. TaxID=1871063 RepID=UPI0039E4174A